MKSGILSRIFAANRSKKRGTSWRSRDGSFMLGRKVPAVYLVERKEGILSGCVCFFL